MWKRGKMKLLELSIEKVRGIKEITISPNGKHFVICGPNGSGKSAIIDSIDFLLTGKVSRLMGQGCGELSLSKHGPHIDHSVKEAKVTATVQLPMSGKIIKISRCMEKPKELFSDENLEEFKGIEALALRGQHVLTRKEILRYITAEGSTRAEEIQALLNISEVENTRKNFIKIKNETERECKGTKKSYEQANAQIGATLHKPDFTATFLLERINQNRKILGGAPINKLDHTVLQKDVSPLTTSPEGNIVNISIFESNIAILKNPLDPQGKKSFTDADGSLRKILTDITADASLLKNLKQKQLIDLGLTLLDESGSCPLCDTKWSKSELQELLKSKQQKAFEAQVQIDKIEKKTSLLKKYCNTLKETISRVVIVAQKYNELKDEVKILNKWIEDIDDYLEILNNVIEEYLKNKFLSTQINVLFAPADISEHLDKITSLIKSKTPKSSPEQTAWDELTRLQENLKSYEITQKSHYKAQEVHKRATILLDSFQIARDAVLTKLYQDIGSGFTDLYKELHESDEKKFNAELKPDGAALKFGVDFHGRGVNPPHALHSEGHQDSMGLCLYLVLNTKLTFGLIDLVLLDDVVMSVDSSHRRRLCTLLGSKFPKRQFIITTHDRTWASQLKSEGIVDKNTLVEFYNWHIETGPQINREVDIWDGIAKDLNREHVSDAAAKLRRGSEAYFSLVCDSLKGFVSYKLNANYELNDFLTGAAHKYKKLIKSAKKSAESWGDDAKVQQLQETESTMTQVFKRAFGEQWAINICVHYNEWENLSKADFEPVVESFQDLFSIFKCNQCGGLLKLTMSGYISQSVKCNCDKVNWNLKGKD